MKNRRGAFFRYGILPVFVLLLLFTDSSVRVLQLKEKSCTASVRFIKPETGEKSSYVNAFQLERIAEKQEDDTLLEISAWKKDKNVLLSDSDLGRSSKASHYIVWGSMEDVIPVDLIYGSYNYGIDKEGCVIDKETAYALYGTFHAVNNIIYFENRCYFVRGIMNTSIPVFMTQGLSRNENYDNLELLFDQKTDGKIAAEEFLLENGYSEGYLLVEGEFYAEWLQHLIGIPFWVLLLGMEIFFLKRLIAAIKKKEMKEIIFLAVGGVIAAAVSGILLFTGILKNPFYVPERFIPSRFSDFTFWAEKAKEIKTWYNQLVYMVPYPKEVLLFSQIKIIAAEGFTNLLGSIGSLSLFKKVNV